MLSLLTWFNCHDSASLHLISDGWLTNWLGGDKKVILHEVVGWSVCQRTASTRSKEIRLHVPDIVISLSKLEALDPLKNTVATMQSN